MSPGGPRARADTIKSVPWEDQAIKDGSGCLAKDRQPGKKGPVSCGSSPECMQPPVDEHTKITALFMMELVLRKAAEVNWRRRSYGSEEDGR